MFLYGKPLEDLISLRHDGQALANDLVGVAPRALAAGSSNLPAIEKDGSALPAGKSGNGVKERRLSMTVESNDTNPLARMDNKIEIVNNPQGSVTGGKTLNFQNFGHRRVHCVSK